MQLVFATHNPNKLKEVQILFPKEIKLLSLEDIGCMDEIPETANDLEGNATLKANFVTENYGYPCFADDTGLLVDALDGAPGVYSARYAGEQKNADDNMDKLLLQLNGKTNRKAHFKTVIALNINNGQFLFKGIVEGEITTRKKGGQGFGYDPIFRPKGYDKTFAEIPILLKNKISHRAKAIEELLAFFKSRTYVDK
ncbi:MULTISPECIES: non-canonical purine NTP diphosphatase [unclassified Arenibacter]|jgi:XTP/dITP diphosphohydrolase|uniref:non-canonical purine NTP diphosphatase n=1 Tax=unclassified Arenibacter TaxID=2615047 RepID=UPI000E348133|nr:MULTISPECIES: non-canonical purine NTP diphosphatase [unclassified Arenibacter]MCM4165692.1 non-canonical purine NTP pyrophosphatase [Arenibacter sp. A80]RFT54545.1 non-canonical purine NTP diphosphatase [Arenibacter sp. P308M17]